MNFDKKKKYIDARGRIYEWRRDMWGTENWCRRIPGGVWESVVKIPETVQEFREEEA